MDKMKIKLTAYGKGEYKGRYIDSITSSDKNVLADFYRDFSNCKIEKEVV